VILLHKGECLPLPNDWTAEQALAVHDFLAGLTDAIWLGYEEPMLALLHGEADPREDDQPDLFGFDDPIPF
jgi:hypothetical protein